MNNRVKEIKEQIEVLQKELDNILSFPEIKSGYRLTLRGGIVGIVCTISTKYFDGICLVDPIKNSHNWLTLNEYNENISPHKKYYDIIKVEKLAHPYSLFYEWEESETEVLWEENGNKNK